MKKGLGRSYDIAHVISPVDLETGANTGAWVDLSNAGGVTFIIYKGKGTAGDDPVLTLQEATDGSGSSNQNLAKLSDWYAKTDTTNHDLSGNETWAHFTQTAAATLDFDNASAEKGADAENAAIVAIYVDASDLSDTYTHVNLSIADVGSNAQIGCVLAILEDPKVQRTPSNLAATQ